MTSAIWGRRACAILVSLALCLTATSAGVPVRVTYASAAPDLRAARTIAQTHSDYLPLIMHDTRFLGVKAISVGEAHTCALTIKGGVKCWGLNRTGRLGDGTLTTRLTPVDVAGLTVGMLAISVGEDHSCALSAGGGVKCWGYNGFGQLGDNTAVDRPTPVDVTGLTSGVQAVDAGDNHTCALTYAGSVKCWGDNFTGQLGDGGTTDSLVPVEVLGLAGPMRAITSGDAHSCALNFDGGVQCWGDNVYGQLGNGTSEGGTLPVDVTGLSSGVQSINAGEHHTCALTFEGSVKCWGRNSHGQLGIGSLENGLIPADVAGLAGGVQAVNGGEYHTCALTNTGAVRCWGNNNYGQLGDGSRINHWTPVEVSDPASRFNATVAAWFHSCARSVEGGVRCWGRNSGGALGDGTTTDRLTPVDVVIR